MGGRQHHIQLLDHPERRLVLRAGARGATLVELMIGLAVLSLLVAIGVPAFQDMIRNYQIRTAA